MYLTLNMLCPAMGKTLLSMALLILLICFALLIRDYELNEELAAHEKYSYEAPHVTVSTEHLKDELDLLVVITGGWSLPMYKDDTHALYLDDILQNYVQVCESGFRPTVVLATYDSIDSTWMNQVIDAKSRFCYRIQKKVDVLIESFPFNVASGFGTAGDLAIRHREIFVRELQNFDLFVSQENDVKLTDRNLHYFVSAYRDLMLQTGLKFHPALFVYEKLNGHRYADWCLRYGKIIRIGDKEYFHGGHLGVSCCAYIGFRRTLLDLMPPNNSAWFDVSLVKNASWGVLNLKYIPVFPLDHLEDAGFHHMPNKYVRLASPVKAGETEHHQFGQCTLGEAAYIFSKCSMVPDKRMSEVNVSIFGDDC